MNKEDFKKTCNSWAAAKKPFLFLIDYEMKKLELISLEEASHYGIYFELNGMGNAGRIDPRKIADFSFDFEPVKFSKYIEAFIKVQKHILHGDTFLLNLTFPTQLSTNLTLDKIFFGSNAPYKILYKNQFVVFSPESFIRIRDGLISSYPMKGTIDASVPDAKKKLLENKKEIWEHNTIVDLIRNDLSMVSKNVKVTKFRYVDHLKTHKKELYQVSSEIQGELDKDWGNKLGDILLTILPAGSISGAPKPKTMEIIGETEGMVRGYFTGVFGIFDGRGVESAVMIRYIEKTSNGLQFRSGGGITGHSDAAEEYNEMIDKVYVPII